MKAKKFGFSQGKRLKIHYTRSKEDDGTLKDTSYSKIDPTKSHLNYNLCDGDLVELLEEKKKKAYVRSEKTDVAFLDIVVPYPKDCSVESRRYFEEIFDIFTHDRTLKHCIGAYVHMDESNPHMHYICMPIEKCPEFTKSKDVRVFDEEKQREVKRRIKTTYTEKFNAKKLFNKEFFNRLHPFIQKMINNRGITGTVITPERVKFNQWKKERLDYYNGLIKSDPANKEKYINQFWEEYKKMNPKDYKKNRPKDKRLDDFNEMVDLYKKELAEENSAVLEVYKAEASKKTEDAKKKISENHAEKIAQLEAKSNEELEKRQIQHKNTLDQIAKEEADKKQELENLQKVYDEEYDNYLSMHNDTQEQIKVFNEKNEELDNKMDWLKHLTDKVDKDTMALLNIERKLRDQEISKKQAKEVVKALGLDEKIKAFRDESAREHTPNLHDLANDRDDR